MRVNRMFGITIVLKEPVFLEEVEFDRFAKPDNIT